MKKIMIFVLNFIISGLIFSSCSMIGDTPAEKLVGAYKVIGGEYDGDVWYFTNYNVYGDSLFIYRGDSLIWDEFCFYDMVDVNPSKWSQVHIFDEWYPEALHPNNPYYPDDYLEGEMKRSNDKIYFRSYDFPFEITAGKVDFVPPTSGTTGHVD